MKTLTTIDAPTLRDLADLLNAATNARADWERHQDGPEVPRVDELYDVTELPTYGGDEPAVTEEIYSWDAESLLYSDGNTPRSWYVSSRTDCAIA